MLVSTLRSALPLRGAAVVGHLWGAAVVGFLFGGAIQALAVQGAIEALAAIFNPSGYWLLTEAHSGRPQHRRAFSTINQNCVARTMLPEADSIESRRQKLVTAEWLERLIDDESCAYTILQVYWEGETPSSTPADCCCIPGAVQVHPSYFELGVYPDYRSPQEGNLLPDHQLQQAVADLGIAANTLVVVVGTGAALAMTGCRVLWALMYAGVRDVRLLHGGLEAWRQHGGPTTAVPALPVPLPEFGGKCACQYVASTEMVAQISAGEREGTIVDVRRLGEFDGSFDGCYEFFTKSGHIPGAVWVGNWTELVQPKSNAYLRDVDQTAAHWAGLGVSRGTGPVVFYCGTGWRSSIGFLLGYMMGLDARNYDDGFYGWFTEDYPIHSADFEQLDMPSSSTNIA